MYFRFWILDIWLSDFQFFIFISDFCFSLSFYFQFWIFLISHFGLIWNLDFRFHIYNIRLLIFSHFWFPIFILSDFGFPIGFLIFDFRFWISDCWFFSYFLFPIFYFPWFWISNWISDFLFQIFWILDFGLQILDFRYLILNFRMSDFRFSFLDFWIKISDVRFQILNFLFLDIRF